MAKLKDDQIKWILSLDAKGVQSELREMSSVSEELTRKNKELDESLSRVNKATKDLQKEQQQIVKDYKAGLISLGKMRERHADLSTSITKNKENAAKLTKEINANKQAIIEQNSNIDKVVKSMKIEDMTMKQLEKRARDLSIELKNTSLAADPVAYHALDKQLQAVKARMGEVSAGTQQATSTFKGGLMVLAGNLMTKAIDKAMQYVMALKDWVTYGLEAAGVIEGVARAFRRLDETGTLLEKLRNQTRNLISDDDLQKAAVRAEKYKINIEEVGNLLEFAGRRATDMGKSVQDFQERIIDGIGKESKIILDDLGITSTEINTAIAETGNFASAVIQIVNKDLKEQGQLELTAADIRQQEMVAWQNAQGAVGEKFLWIEKIWNEFSISFAEDVQKWASDTLPNLIQKVVDVYNWFISLYNESIAIRAVLGTITLNFEVLWKAAKLVINNMINAWQAAGGVIKGALTFDWDLMKDSAKSYLDNTKDLVFDFAKDIKDTMKGSLDEVLNGKHELVIIPPKSSSDPEGNTKPPGKNPVDPKTAKKKQDQELEEIEAKHYERLYKIKDDYRKGNIKSEAEFNRALFAQEQSYLLLREEKLDHFLNTTTNKELRVDLEKKLADIRNKRLDQEIKFRSSLEKVILDANPLAKEQKEYEERLAAHNLFGVEKEKMTKEQLEVFELLEKQHQENILKIKRQGAAMDKADAETKFSESFAEEKERLQGELNALIQNAALSHGSNYEAEMLVHQKRLEMIRAEMDARTQAGLETSKQQKAAGKEEADMTSTVRKEVERRSALYAKYGSDIGQTLGEVMTGQVNALEAFGNTTLDIMFDVLNEIINTELSKVMATSTSAIMRATAESMATPGSALTFGAKGFATAAILTGAIMAATTAAKATLKGMLGKKSKGSGSSSSGAQGSGSSGSITVKPRSFAEGGHNAGQTGGYTGDGGRYEVAGIFDNGASFHRGEYIVASPELARPEVVHMVRQLETIRRQRTSENTTNSFAEGGYNSDNDSYDLMLGDSKLAERMMQVLEKIEKKDFTPRIGASQLQVELDEFNKDKNRFTQKK